MHTFTTAQVLVAALSYAFVILFAINAVIESVKAQRGHDNVVEQLEELLRAECAETARLQQTVIELVAEHAQQF